MISVNFYTLLFLQVMYDEYKKLTHVEKSALVSVLYKKKKFGQPKNHCIILKFEQCSFTISGAAKDREGWKGIVAMSSVVPRGPPRLRD